ncbi:WXG100 family type VII secretion target [Streptomyces sp. NPDC087659]|uniref:WXG100 family type VII secretion target n=1 Tax=Streptomyces sp. NPDC087659 TaxID=3365801 RepID=UPI00380B6AAE
MPDLDDLTDGYIYVAYDHMRNAADNLVHQTRAIDRIVDALVAELNALSVTWIGNAADVYQGKQKTWNATVEDMKNLLLSHIGTLDDISDLYKTNDQMLGALWGG